MNLGAKRALRASLNLALRYRILDREMLRNNDLFESEESKQVKREKVFIQINIATFATRKSFLNSKCELVSESYLCDSKVWGMQ